MTRTAYMINGFLKHSEEDIFNDGCLPETGQSSFIDYVIEAGSVAGCIEQAATFIGISRKCDIYINACDEPGRIDFQVYKDAEGLPASAFDFEQWRKGSKKLWLCTYSTELLEVKQGKPLPPAVIDSATELSKVNKMTIALKGLYHDGSTFYKTFNSIPELAKARKALKLLEKPEHMCIWDDDGTADYSTLVVIRDRQRYA